MPRESIQFMIWLQLQKFVASGTSKGKSDDIAVVNITLFVGQLDRRTQGNISIGICLCPPVFFKFLVKELKEICNSQSAESEIV